MPNDRHNNYFHLCDPCEFPRRSKYHVFILQKVSKNWELVRKKSGKGQEIASLVTCGNPGLVIKWKSLSCLQICICFYVRFCVMWNDMSLQYDKKIVTVGQNCKPFGIYRDWHPIMNSHCLISASETLDSTFIRQDQLDPWITVKSLISDIPKSQSLNVSHHGLQLSLCNIFKPIFKRRMKM